MPHDRYVIGVPLGRWQTNCFVVGDREEGTCVVIDPGEGAAERVPKVLAEVGTSCEAILLTHGHLDHHWSAPDLARSFDVPVFLHEDDRWIWDNPAAGFGNVPASVLEQQFGLEWDPADDHLETLSGDATLTLAGIRFDVKHNPGHTPGHVTYLGHDLADADVDFRLGSVEEGTGEVLFSGDLIFAGSVGRTDFPRGSTEALLQSLVDTVLPLEDDTLILSGHGPETTVGTERGRNPYLAEARRRFETPSE